MVQAGSLPSVFCCESILNPCALAWETWNGRGVNHEDDVEGLLLLVQPDEPPRQEPPPQLLQTCLTLVHVDRHGPAHLPYLSVENVDKVVLGNFVDNFQNLSLGLFQESLSCSVPPCLPSSPGSSTSHCTGQANRATSERWKVSLLKNTSLLFPDAVPVAEEFPHQQVGAMILRHMSPEHASREKNCPQYFFIFVHKNVHRNRFQETFQWFLRPYFQLIRGMLVFRSGLRVVQKAGRHISAKHRPQEELLVGYILTALDQGQLVVCCCWGEREFPFPSIPKNENL